jgi:hypothetical protein
MRKYLKEYVSDFERELNLPLINKSADKPLVEFIKDVWKSLEVVKNIKIVKFEYNENESELDINKFIFKREKKKKKKDRCDYKMVNDDRYGCLTVWIQITVEESENGAEPSIRQKLFKKQMLIPIQDEDGYYFIKGKRYYIIYQLVDKSTYTSSSTVTLKSLSSALATINLFNCWKLLRA